MKKVIWYLTAILVVNMSCRKNEIISNSITANGFLLKSVNVTYGYGSYTLMKDKTSNVTNYALKSTNTKLDDFTNQQVKIVGKPVAGYPVDGGPIFLEVLSIQKE